MHIKTLSAWVLAGLLLAVPAGAAEVGWDITPGDTSVLAGTCTFAKTNICYADLNAATDTTGILDTRSCENWSAHWIAEIANENNTKTLQVRWSMADTESVNTSEPVNNVTLTGDPATGLDVLAGYDSPYLYADVIVDTGDVGRLSVQCFDRARRR